MKSHSYDCLHRACTTSSQATVQHWGEGPTASISSGAAVEVGGFGERELVFSKSVVPLCELYMGSTHGTQWITN